MVQIDADSYREAQNTDEQNTGLLIVRLVRITTAPAQFAKKLIGPKACGAKLLMRPRRDR